MWIRDTGCYSDGVVNRCRKYLKSDSLRLWRKIRCHAFLMSQNLSVSPTDPDRLGVSAMGAVHTMTFRGLDGNFTLMDAHLQLHVYEIFNIVGRGARIVGFWTPESGILPALKNSISVEMNHEETAAVSFLDGS
jgi:hypothetical protein